MKMKRIATVALVVACALTLPVEAGPSKDRGFRPVQRLLDLSGLAWTGGDTFLAVHDAKNPDELRRVRVSLLMLPESLEGLLWKPLRLRFPGGPSSDLESAAAIPGTSQVLLVESGDDASDFERIFLAVVKRNRVDVVDGVSWSSFTDVFNVEATAVAETERGYLFIWAERASGQQSTQIRWAEMTLHPFEIGPEAGSATFTLPDDFVDAGGNPLYSRPVVGLDVDADGRVYIITAFDPEGTVDDPDNGPFRGAALHIGEVIDGAVKLSSQPLLVATIDGFKPESIATRDVGDGIELFVGTDDENYGGTLRKLPPVELPVQDDDGGDGCEDVADDDGIGIVGVRCTFSTSQDAVDFAGLVADVNEDLAGSISLAVTADSAVVIESWGGRGQDGKDIGEPNCKHGDGADGGYARTVQTVGGIEAIIGSNDLYLYVGERGPGNSNGGSASLLLGQAVTDVGDVRDPENESVFVIAGGGGGGGKETDTDFDCKNGYDGGAGGTAIATTAQAASGAGQDGANSKKGHGGNADGQGSGGTSDHAGDGNDGIGGFGSQGKAGWTGSELTLDDYAGGRGGEGGGDEKAGGGGGGFGGGSGGRADDHKGGGGGGGSWARQSEVADQDLAESLILEPGADPEDPRVVLTFELR